MVARSNHPVSACVAEALARSSASLPTPRWGAAQGGELPTMAADDLREVTGQGLSWQGGAGEYRFGRPDFVLELGLGAAGGGARPIFPRDAFPGEGFPGAMLALDGEPLLTLELEEDLRPDAAAEVEALQELGLSVHLFSGDAASKVSIVASELSLPATQILGDLSPEQKAEAVAALDHHDTLMVGDGLNDSLSFDAAYCKATPAVDRAILPQKADFYFLGDGIGAVRHAIEMARHLHRVQRGNLLFAALYNLVAVALCLAGVVDPVVAAILMPLSSVTVVILTSHRLARRSLRWTS
jgi:Cu2+-exporting ATPase